MASASLPALISAGLLSIGHGDAHILPDPAASSIVGGPLPPAPAPNAGHITTGSTLHRSSEVPPPLHGTVGSPLKARPPTDGPSLVLKAYTAALRPFLTLKQDLSEAEQAVFVAGPLQFGFPTGFAKDEYINEALFAMADPMQSPSSPGFGLGGASYFDALNRRELTDAWWLSVYETNGVLVMWRT